MAVTAVEEEKPIYFTMKIPDWFNNLGDKEKEQLVRKLAENSQEGRELTDQELYDLMATE